MTEDSEYTTHPLADNGEVLFNSGGTSDCYKRIIGNHTYCFKRPKPQYRSSEDYMNLFRKEFELGVELEHPNIVRYFDYGEDEKGPFIKMDYVDGEGLDEFVTKHPDFFKNRQNRRRLLDELLDALAYLHGKRMLHLDLKPSNILITHNGQHVKLVDLGFAWTDGYLHDTGYSRDYCAPEQLSGNTEAISPATDIYALGKIMQRFHLAKDSVVKRCLKENPKERFQSIEALKKTLQPKRWSFVLLAILIIGLIGWVLLTTIKQAEPNLRAEPTSQLTLDDSLAIFKEDLQNTLAPTFSYWYGELYDGVACSDCVTYSVEKGGFVPTRSLVMEVFLDKVLTASQSIIKEKLNTMHLSETVKPHYEQAAQEVVDYYLRDYRELKKQLEREMELEKQ
jgi:serine/threonine protein kinase